jgi:SAM-dependent methyltransferase
LQEKGSVEDILYSHLYRTEPHHWWYAGRRKIIFDRILPQLSQYKSARILDVGCGTGYDIQCLQQYGHDHVMGLDISLEALRFCQKRSITQLVRGNGTLLSFPDNSFDMVLALDILELVQDDLTALREQARVLRPGGTLVILTVAYEFLRSFHDDFYHNLRRYEIEDLQDKVQQAGLTISKLTYANTFLFPIVLLGRMVMRIMGRPKYVTSENDLHPVWSNAFLKSVFAAESLLLHHINLPFGTSILCIAKK